MPERVSILLQFVATTSVAILLNITANKLSPKWADPLLRWGWFGVLLYVTYLLMSIEFIQRKLIPLAGSPVRSFVVAGLIGVLIALVYWASIIRLHDKLIVQSDQPATTTQSQKTVENSTKTPPLLTNPTEQKRTAPSIPATIKNEVTNAPKTELPPQLHDQNLKHSTTVNQTMTDSPGAIQGGRDVIIGEKPSPTATEKGKMP